MLRVTPVYGSSLSSASAANNNGGDDDPLEWLSSPGPSCTLVEYAGVKLLLNAGWDESLPMSTSSPSPTSGDGKTDDGDEADNDGTSQEDSKKCNIIPKELPSDVDAILVCDSTLSSLGGLPMYYGASKDSKRGRAPKGKGRNNPPFLATYPTVKMGQMTMYDHHASQSLDGNNPGYSLEDVDAVFGKDSFRTLKYSQTVYLPFDDKEGDGDAMEVDVPKKRLGDSKTSNKLLAITPHLSGHVVGGCYWVLKQLSDDTEIVLAPTYHHAKERHLAGSTLHKFGLNADALVTTPGGPRGLLGKLYQPPPPMKERGSQSVIKWKKGNKPILPPPVGNRSESTLIESIMTTLRRDGNVLLPVDASGRVLELLLVLDRHWEKQRLGEAYNLIWVGPMSLNTIEFARSQLEWMAPPLGALFDSQRGHPYQLKSVRICSSVGELDKVVEKSNGNPTCVLASGATLDAGPARDLLLKWGSNPDNLVLLTDSRRCVPRGEVWFGRREGVEDKSAAAKELTAAVVEEGEKDEEGNQQLGAVLSPSDVSAYTTSSQLLYQWCKSKALGEEMPDEVSVDIYVPHRAPLSGNELKEFLAEEEEERRLKKEEAERKAMMREIEIARGRLRLGGDEETGTSVGTGKSGSSGPGSKAAAGKSKAAATATGRPKKKSRFDQSLFIKFSKPVHMTFPVREEAVGIGQPDSVALYGIGESVGRSDVLEDDYGIAVRADSFVDIVTGVDPSRFGKSGRIGEEVTRRGLGFGMDAKPGGEAGGGAEVTKGDGKDGEGDDEVDEKVLEVTDLSSGKGIIKGRNGRPPIKVSTVPRKLEVLAEVAYSPLEGRVDARAARQSVRALQPRHLVIVGGPKSNSLLLADALRTSNNNDASSAYMPADRETVRLTVGHAAYGARLIDTPYLTPSQKEEIEDLGKEIEPVEPHEAKIGDCTVSLVDYVATGKRWAVDGSYVLAPRYGKKNMLNQPSLMLSTREVLLTDLRAEVTALGMKADYAALSGYSQLIVNGKIVVRKDNATGKLDVEGPLCSDFYAVRSVVCGQYVTI